MNEENRIFNTIKGDDNNKEKMASSSGLALLNIHTHIWVAATSQQHTRALTSERERAPKVRLFSFDITTILFFNYFLAVRK